MKKFYKVKKENFLWDVGAILAEGNNGYSPINDIFAKNESPKKDDHEVISFYIVENQPEYFERVYEVNLLTKIVYKLKEEAKEIFSKEIQ